MANTKNLVLPLIAASQAQKHVTVNEALSILDGFAQIAIEDRDLTAPPASPDEGDRYLVAVGATGAWTGKSGSIALFSAGGWIFVPARIGMLVYIVDEDLLVLRRPGGVWSTVAFI